MKLSGKAVVLMAVLSGGSVLAGCTPTPTGKQAGATEAPTDKPLALIEVVARPAGEPAGAFARPTHPGDTVEIAMRTEGSTKGADLAVKMIALADGSTAGTRTLRLNAGNTATPKLEFKPDGAWATGRYLFEVTLDGKLAGSQELEIFPADPAAPAPASVPSP